MYKGFWKILVPGHTLPTYLPTYQGIFGLRRALPVDLFGISSEQRQDPESPCPTYFRHTSDIHPAPFGLEAPISCAAYPSDIAFRHTLLTYPLSQGAFLSIKTSWHCREAPAFALPIHTLQPESPGPAYFRHTSDIPSAPFPARGPNVTLLCRLPFRHTLPTYPLSQRAPLSIKTSWHCREAPPFALPIHTIHHEAGQSFSWERLATDTEHAVIACQH